MKSASQLSREEKVALCAELYAQGLSSYDIQAQTGIGKSSAAVYVREAGLTLDASARISAKMTGRPGPRRGATHTPEARAKISAARTGRATTTGQKRTEAQREKMTRAQQDLGRLRKVIKSQRALFRRSPMPRLPPHEKAARARARNASKNMLRRVLVMARVRKDASTELLLGYTKDQLKRHLESQFKPGMSWAARESFHIDHIRPVADFFRAGIFDPAQINALSNLQVLTPEQNRAKRDRLDWPGKVINRILTITATAVRPGIHQLA